MKVANVSPTFRDPKTFDHWQPRPRGCWAALAMAVEGHCTALAFTDAPAQRWHERSL